MLGVNIWWNYSWGSVAFEDLTNVEKIVTLRKVVSFNTSASLLNFFNPNFSVDTIRVLLDISMVILEFFCLLVNFKIDLEEDLLQNTFGLTIS